MHPLARMLPSKSVDCSIFRHRWSSTCRAGAPVEEGVETSEMAGSGNSSSSTCCWAKAAMCCTTRDRPPSWRWSNSLIRGLVTAPVLSPFCLLLFDGEEDGSQALMAERQRRMWPCHCGVLRCLKDPSAKVKIQAPISLLRYRKRSSLKYVRNCLRSECENCWNSLFRSSPSLPRYFTRKE